MEYLILFILTINRYLSFAVTLAMLFNVEIHAQDRADRQHLIDPGSFTMILLGDPQQYVAVTVNQPLLELCTAWIADNVDNLKIKAALCTGDIVGENESIHITGNNQTSREMWEAASKAFARLDNIVPYMFSLGNHDYGYHSAENESTHFPEYFPFERNRAWRKLYVSAMPNRNGIHSLENIAFEFKDPHWGSVLIITSEYHPRDEVLEWAKQLAASDTYKNSKVIFMTHSYMEIGNNAPLVKGENCFPGNDGIQIWEKLLHPSANINLLICGHWCVANEKFADNVGYRIDKNSAGRNVHQMMFNVQTLGGGWTSNGGDGWLRILEFMPDGKTIKVRTYSPLFGISPSTKHLAHRTEPYDQFDMVIK